jgi:hypothetical protein
LQPGYAAAAYSHTVRNGTWTVAQVLTEPLDASIETKVLTIPSSNIFVLAVVIAVSCAQLLAGYWICDRQVK